MADEAQVHRRERKALLLLLGVSFAATAIAFLLVGVRPMGKPTGMTARPRIQWLPQQHASQDNGLLTLYRTAELQDPSLLSLPNAHGFSAQLWARNAVPTHRDTPWDVAPAYLDPSAPAGFRSLLDQSPLTEAVQKVEKVPAESEDEPVETVEPTPPFDQSVFQVLGTLESRAIVLAPPLPVITSEVPLRATRVRVAVALDGTVSYAILDRSCGDDTIDARAVELAGKIRFEPLPATGPADLNWGVIRFLWATTRPGASTDAVSAARS